MMTYRTFSLLWGVSLLGISGCSQGISGITPSDSPEMKKQSDTEQSQYLAPQDMAVGDCGLFVWSADEARHFILFSQSRNGDGFFSDGQGEIKLKITQEEGETSEEQFVHTEYLTAQNRKLKLQLQRGQNIKGGTRYRAGTLHITHEGGWDEVRPIVGVTVCQTE